MPWRSFARAGWVPFGLVVLVALLVSTGVAAAQAAPTLPPPPLPKAWVLVDVDTGAVLAGSDAHTPMPPASTIKVLTALIAMQRLPVHDQVPISALAEGMPARKINVKAGQVWDREDLLESMLLVSANDAAVALAERAGGGSLDGWVRIAQATAARLSMADNPTINDPSGLDDEFSHNGGTLISARDLAIAARAVVARPDIMAIAQTSHYEFHGGDGLDHELNNHDTFLGLYPGATGLKTGLTDRAGRTLIATAQRDGRTMMTVEFDAVDIYASARQLLDIGFATPVSAEARLDHLPNVVPDASLDSPPTTRAPAHASEAALAAPSPGGSQAAAPDPAAAEAWWNSPPVAVPLLFIGSAPLLVVLRRRAVRRQLSDSEVSEP